MRVIGGSARGRQLVEFPGRAIRPTPDRVREALFSIVYSRRGPLTGCSVLDLFAGSGALGIEALSRGAAHAWMVDRSPQAIATIRQNLQRCRLTSQATVMAADLSAALPELAAAGPFDLILADPPYGGEHIMMLLKAICDQRLLADEGLMCLETAVTDPVPEQVATLVLVDWRRYGSTRLNFFQPFQEVSA